MKKLALWAIAFGFVLAGCHQQTEKGDFVINAKIDNAPLGTVVLEELSMDTLKIVDSVTLKDASGKFTLKGMLPEQGLYRIRFGEDQQRFILLALDAGTMSITGDLNNLELVKFENAEASTELQQLLNDVSAKSRMLTEESMALDSLAKSGVGDSAIQVKTEALQAKEKEVTDFVMHTATTSKNPAVAAFALSMINPQSLMGSGKEIAEVKSHFPTNTLVVGLTSKLEQMLKQAAGEVDANMTALQVGQEAPDFSLPDATGKMVSLSSFKGKFVLVDFWASWCQPCRMENPNVVKAYNAYKGKNFTVLGVSLDKKKEAWLEAIQKDGLTWTHVSDLKFWESAVVPLYGINSIPTNMLLDPSGKILGIGLRGEALEAKLAEVIK
jgi:peroxiredoxin